MKRRKMPKDFGMLQDDAQSLSTKGRVLSLVRQPAPYQIALFRLAPANDWGFKTQFSDALLGKKEKLELSAASNQDETD